MPDENRFAGLSEAVDEDDGDGADEPDSDAESTGDADSDGVTGAASTTDSKTADSETVSDSTPADTPSGGSSTGGGATTESEPEPATESAETSDSSDPVDPAAFAFDETTKKTVYVLPDTLDDLEDARALVDARLRTQHDVRDLTGREFYDAAFRLAAADTDGLIDGILAAREE